MLSFRFSPFDCPCVHSLLRSPFIFTGLKISRLVKFGTSCMQVLPPWRGGGKGKERGEGEGKGGEIPFMNMESDRRLWSPRSTVAPVPLKNGSSRSRTEKLRRSRPQKIKRSSCYVSRKENHWIQVVSSQTYRPDSQWKQNTRFFLGNALPVMVVKLKRRLYVF